MNVRPLLTGRCFCENRSEFDKCISRKLVKYFEFVNGSFGKMQVKVLKKRV